MSPIPLGGAATTSALCLGLVALALLPAPRYSRTDQSLANKVLRTLHKVEVNREAHEAQTAGYYEGLLNESSRVSSMNALITGNEQFTPESWSRPWRRHRNDYLYWDMPPNLKTRDEDDPRFDIETNSHGMADREYSLEKPDRTWRVALLGDSITRGQGTAFGKNYEFVLEERLDREFFRPAGYHFEMLNFSVGGYRITQLVDVGLDRAPEFSPDLYVLPLSELSVFSRWGEHLATLVQNDIDLKYGYLREVVRDAAIRKSDSAATIAAKLARYRMPTLRWAVQSLQESAARQRAGMVVILLANGTEPEMLEEQFIGVREMLDELHMPYIDVLDAYADVDEPIDYRVSERNVHPNEAGHRRLADLLYAHIVRDPSMFRLFCGPNALAPGAGSR